MAKRASSSSSTPKPTTPKAAASKKKAVAASDVAATTPVRKTVVPKKTPTAKAAPAPIPHERIAERAYHIWRSGMGGSDAENWLRAEIELKNETGL